jgi:hypothetical protein
VSRILWTSLFFQAQRRRTACARNTTSSGGARSSRRQDRGTNLGGKLEQYMEIDDELPEQPATSSPTATLTSTSTSSNNRRKTRRQTRSESCVRPPAIMPGPSSSEKDEPVAQVPRSCRRAKKSLSPAAPRWTSRNWLGLRSTSEIHQIRS